MADPIVPASRSAPPLIPVLPLAYEPVMPGDVAARRALPRGLLLLAAALSITFIRTAVVRFVPASALSRLGCTWIIVGLSLLNAMLMLLGG